MVSESRPRTEHMPDRTNPHREGTTLPKDNRRELSPFDLPRQVVDPDVAFGDCHKLESFGPTTHQVKKYGSDGLGDVSDPNKPRLSPVRDLVCPSCKTVIASTGNMRCYYCGRTARPIGYTYGRSSKQKPKAISAAQWRNR